tara:strand:+ start:5329 stop:6117 length:789 start_codon:yes stop_codon:yes gene_type:complete
MATQDITTEALYMCFSDYEDLLKNLSEEQWNVQSLCPDWDTRGVGVHLSGIEDLLIGWSPSNPEEWPPFGKLAQFEKTSTEWNNASFVEKTKNILEERRRELEELDEAGWDIPCMTPVGSGTYGRFMNIRVFDFWVHQRDITLPLGVETNDSGAHAEIALDEVHGSLGYIVGKKIGLPEGMSIGIRLNGGIERDMFVNVDGRAQVVNEINSPSVELVVDSTSFIMLACGRIDPEEEIRAGRISWSGDVEWGEKAARNLRFTM